MIHFYSLLLIFTCCFYPAESLQAKNTDRNNANPENIQRNNTAPLAAASLVCPSDILASANPLNCNAVINYEMPAPPDNCPVTDFGIQHHSGDTIASTYFCDTFAVAKHLRVFDLSAMGVSNDFFITSITMGIAFSPENSALTVNIYQLDGALSYANMTLLATNTVNMPVVFQGFFDFPVTAHISPDLPIVVEMVLPPGGHTIPAFNFEPQTAPSYFASDHCNSPEPQNLADLGNPDFSLLLGINAADALITQIAGLPSGSTFPVGLTTNTFTYEDLAGNQDECSFDVVVEDDSPPFLDCPQSITLESEPGLCGTNFYYEINANENCAEYTYQITGGLASGELFPLGITYNVVVATDNSGNQSSCNFSVNVIDVVPPEINCSPDIIQDTDISNCSAVIDYNIEAFDNCEVTNLVQISGLQSGSSFPVGPTINRFMATDAAGNTSTCSFTVTVLERELPEAICPEDLTVFVNENECETIVNFDLPEAADNCVLFPATLRQHQNNLITVGYGCDSSGTSHHLRVFDMEIMGLTGTFAVSGVNAAFGFVTGNTDITINIYELEGVLDFANMELVSSITETLPQIFNDYYEVPISATLTAGTIYVFEMILPNGQMAGYNQGLQDAPSYYFAPDCGVDAPTNLANIGLPDFSLLLEVRGELSPEFVIEQTGGLPAGSIFPMGTTTNSFTIQDPSGNMASCSFNVIVMDIPPVIFCPEDVFYNGSDACAAFIEVGIPEAMDNCGGVSWINDFNNSENASGTYPPGNTIVTWIATDDNGNTSTCTQNVTFSTSIISAEVLTFPASCNGGADGSAAISIITATPPTSQVWSTGSTATEIENLASGIYGVTVTDGNNCTFVSQAIIEEPEALVVADTTLVASSPDDATGEIGINLLGGTPPYFYEWNNGGTSSQLTNLAAGEYYCTVSDEQNCQAVFGPFTIEMLSAARDAVFVSKLNLYPNPAQHFTTLELELRRQEMVSIRVFNTAGKMILLQNPGVVSSVKTMLDLNRFLPGIYYVEIVTGSQTAFRKLIVTK